MHYMQVLIRFSVWFDYWADAVHAILLISVFDFKDILIIGKVSKLHFCCFYAFLCLMHNINENLDFRLKRIYDCMIALVTFQIFHNFNNFC